MTDAGPAALIELAARGVPFALIARDAATVELLTGDVVDVELLADIPLDRLRTAPRRRCSRSCRSGRCASAASSATTMARPCAAWWFGIAR